MEVKKNKICKFFKCNKEVHSPKAKFCGEHERFYREHRNKIGGALLTFGGIALSALVKKRNN